MQPLLNGILVGLTYGLWALSFSVIYRASKVFHVLHAAAFVAAGYTYWAMQHYLAAPFWVGALLAVLVAMAVGMASERVLYRPLLRIGGNPGALFLASLGGYYVLQNIIQLIWRADVRMGMPPPVLDRLVALGPLQVSGVEVLGSVFALGAWLTTLALLRLTMSGKATRAISVAPDLAELAGISVDNVRLLVFCYGSALAGVAGVLLVIRSGITPAAGLPVWIVAVVTSLIARADPSWAVPIALGLGLLENVTLIWVSTGWQPAIPVVVLIIFVIQEAIFRGISAWRTRRRAQWVAANA